MGNKWRKTLGSLQVSAMTLEELQKKFNKRIKSGRNKKKEHIFIPHKDEYFTHPHDSGKPMFNRTQRHARVGKMNGQK